MQLAFRSKASSYSRRSAVLPMRTSMHALVQPVSVSKAFKAKGSVARTGFQSKVGLSVNASLGGQTASKSFYDFSVKDIDGNEIKLDKFKGKVSLVVNLASQCGFTPQYTELQKLQEKLGSKGFTVIGFPCNQFGGQEPGSNAEIKRFALSKFSVSFPLMSKVDVNGATASPVFDFLKNQKGGFLNSDIKWNFSKFLVDKEGNVVGRYGSSTTPATIEADILKYL